MLPLQDLLVNLNLVKRELMIPLDTQKFFYVDADNTKNFLDQVLEMEETNMKFFNVKQSKPYSNSLDKATIVNNSNATVMQQETFTKTTTDSFTFTNSRGLNKGGAVNATIGTAFLGGVGTTLNLSFNVTNTASTSKNVAQSRSQQQTITCPAQTSLVATWVIKNVDIDADYKMVLKLGQKPALKYGLIPGKVVTSDQPVAPVYRYTDAKGERFVYLPSTDAQVTDFYLDDLNPVFYVPAPPTQSNLAIQAGGSHRGHLKNLLWKGAHTDRALVPVYASGSSQLDSSNASTELQQTFQVNSQFTTGSVALWRYRKAGTEEPQFRLIPSNNPEMIPGWSNEGSVGFVYLAPPGMKDLDGTKLGGHAHALNEVSPNEKEKDVVAATKKKLKCSKCWNKIELMETYFRCEQCKTPYMECVECHQKSEKPVEKLLDQVVAKFYEAFGSLEKKKRSFAVLGKMHCTQGTHTFIDVSPMTDSDKDQAQQQVQPQMKEVAEEEKQKEKSRKSKKMVEEFKYTKQYIEEDTKEKKSSHKKTEKVLDNDLPLPPPPPPLVPAMSQLSIQQPLPPPPPPLPPNFACTAPSPFGNPYFANPTQMFINNPSTVQPYFAPAPAPPPPPAPFAAGPVPTTTHTITTTYPPVTNAPNGRRGSIAGPAPASAPPPPPPPPPPASPAYPTPSVEDLYSMPMGHYNNPNYASPVWGAPRYDVPNYNEQGNYNSPQPFAQPSYDPNAYSGMPAGYPAYDAKPHYNPDAPPAQGYDSNFNQSYQSPYQQPPPVNRTRNFFTRHQIL